MEKERMMDAKVNTDTKEACESILDHLAAEMDNGFMMAGKNLAELFRAVCIAAVKLPEMDLHTELVSIHNNEEGLTVSFHRDVVEGRKDGTGHAFSQPSGGALWRRLRFMGKTISVSCCLAGRRSKHENRIQPCRM